MARPYEGVHRELQWDALLHENRVKKKKTQAVESDDLDFMPSAEPEELTSTESDEDYRPPMEDQDLVESEDKMPPSPAACKSRKSLRADDKDKRNEKDEGSEIVQESNGLHKEDDEAEDDKEDDENDEKKREKKRKMTITKIMEGLARKDKQCFTPKMFAN